MAGTTRVVTFSEGVSVSAPSQAFLIASSLETYANDAAYETAKGSSATEGDIYGNTTDGVVRYRGTSAFDALVSETGTQAVTNKDIDGGTASNTIRVTLPKGSFATISALTRKEGTVLYGTDTKKFYYDNGTTLIDPSTSSASLTNVNSVLNNLGLSVIMAANAVTIALKQEDSTSDPTGGGPVTMGFRSSTLTSGAHSLVQATSATSTVISSGSTGGQASATTYPIYVYAINNAGTIELAWSRLHFRNETKLVSTTGEGGTGGADDNGIMYSTTTRASVAFRLIGSFISTQATAGTWASSPTEVFVGGQDSIAYEPIVWEARDSSALSIGTSSDTNVTFPTISRDPYNAYSSATGGFVCPCDGLIKTKAQIAWDSTSWPVTSGRIMYIRRESTDKVGDFQTSPATATSREMGRGSVEFEVSKGDEIKVYANQDSGVTKNLFNDGIFNVFSGTLEQYV